MVQYSCDNPIGMNLEELVSWAESLRDEYGGEVRLEGLYLDDDDTSSLELSGIEDFDEDEDD